MEQDHIKLVGYEQYKKDMAKVNEEEEREGENTDGLTKETAAQLDRDHRTYQKAIDRQK